MYSLYIGNKNYSSWSLRAWVLLRELGIPFAEHMLTFGDPATWQAYREISPTGKVPCLVDGAIKVWDSLAIAEYLGERHPVWPIEREARAWARCAAAEMHAGFQELRTRCPMSCGVTLRLHDHPTGLTRDIERIGALWRDGLERFGGPFLAGSVFTAVDAFFAPVAYRVQTYGLNLDGGAAAYVAKLLNLGSMREWFTAALAESTRDMPHEAEILRTGELIEDRRVRAAN